MKNTHESPNHCQKHLRCYPSLGTHCHKYFFGSEARGDAREDSDIDVLVLLDADNDFVEREGEVTYELFLLGLKNGVEINPVILRRSHWDKRPFKTPFYCNVMNEGILI